MGSEVIVRAQPSAIAELVDGEVMDSSLLSRRAGAAVAAMCPAMIGTAPGYSAAPVRAVLPCTPTALTAYNWRARVMCAGWIGSGVVVEFARAYDAGLRAWSVSIGQHRASRREAEQRPREARFCRPHRGRVCVRWASGLLAERAGGQKRRRRPDFGSYSTYLVPGSI